MRIILISLVCVMCLSALAAGPGPEKFKDNWADAQKAAKADNKPIFIQFAVSWSIPDRAMAEKILVNKDVTLALADYVCVTLDCTPSAHGEPSPAVKANIDRMKSYGGLGTPFFALVTAEGEYVYSMSGYRDAGLMVERLGNAKQALKAYQEFQDYAAKADKNSNDYKIRQLQFDLRFHLHDKAKTLADEMLKADPVGSKGLAAEAKLAMIQLTPLKDDPEKTQPLYEDVKKLDPKNERGYWERATNLQAERYYTQAMKAEDVAEYRQKLAGATVLVEDLLKNAAHFDDRRGVYQMALFLYKAQDSTDKELGVIGELLKGAKAEEAKALTRRQKELMLKKAILGAVETQPTSAPATKPHK